MITKTKAHFLRQYTKKYGKEVGQQLFDDLISAGGDKDQEHAAITRAEQTIERSKNHSHHFNETDDNHRN